LHEHWVLHLFAFESKLSMLTNAKPRLSPRFCLYVGMTTGSSNFFEDIASFNLS
jgi:hypothetical protein